MSLCAANAKIHAMRGELFAKADYISICEMGSVAEIGAHLLERRGYAGALAPVEGTELHRGTVERRIALSLFDDYERIRFYINDGGDLEFMDHFFFRYTLKTLKILLCMFFDERDVPYNASELDVIFAKSMNADPAKLAASKTIQDFIEALRGSPVYGLIADSFARQPSLFTIERQLDLYYYLQIQKKIQKIKNAKSREAVEGIIGTEIDLFNILWVYRIKRYYTVHSEQIYAYLVPAGRLLNTDALRRIVECPDVDALKEETAAGPYKDVFGDFSSPERSVETAKKRKYTAETRKAPDTLVTAVGYLFDKEREIFNITSVIEGVRYKLKPDAIMNMLLGVA